MTDHKPYADRLKDEVDAFFRLWKERRWMAIVFLALVLGAAVYFIVAWHQRGSAIENLKTENRDLQSRNSDLARDLRSIEAENKGLRETVAPSDPRKQRILSATATVEIRVDGKHDAGNMMGAEAILAFGKNGQAFLVMSSRECNVRRQGENESIYRAVLTADATQAAIGKPLTALKETDVLQVEFMLIPKGSNVLGGKAICTFNNSIQMTFEIPAQETKANHILFHDPKVITDALGD